MGSKEKKNKKEKKRKSRDNDDDDSDDDEHRHEQQQKEEKKDDGSPAAAAEQETAAASRKRRREERKRLTEQLPKVDENGIAYTKQQLRRMRKRLKRGLDPIETSREAHERLRREAELRREEEEELAGLLVRSKELDDEKDSNDNDDSINDEDEKILGDGDGEISDNQEGDDDDHDDDDHDGTKRELTNKKKRPRSSKKEVPLDYTCQACQNRITPRHWIYDCPEKVTVRGRNQVSKKLKGIHNPSSRKVFVSGLPFDAKAKDVQSMFANTSSNKKPPHCKLVTFPDSGRCKGQAFLTFETDDDAKMALRLSGTTIENSAASSSSGKDNNKKKKKKEAGDSSGRKELKLKVTMAMNRFASKHQHHRGNNDKKTTSPPTKTSV